MSATQTRYGHRRILYSQFSLPNAPINPSNKDPDNPRQPYALFVPPLISFLMYSALTLSSDHALPGLSFWLIRMNKCRSEWGTQ